MEYLGKKICHFLKQTERSKSFIILCIISHKHHLITVLFSKPENKLIKLTNGNLVKWWLGLQGGWIYSHPTHSKFSPLKIFPIIKWPKHNSDVCFQCRRSRLRLPDCATILFSSFCESRPESFMPNTKSLLELRHGEVLARQWAFSERGRNLWGYNKATCQR